MFYNENDHFSGDQREHKTLYELTKNINKP